MKKIAIITSVITISLAMSSCSLFQGGGGGSHCPAYGSSIEKNDVQDLEKIKKSEITQISSERV